MNSTPLLAWHSAGSAARRLHAPSLPPPQLFAVKQAGDELPEGIDFIGRTRGPGFQRKRSKRVLVARDHNPIESTDGAVQRDRQVREIAAIDQLLGFVRMKA